ncbi:MAG: type II/IV secretion system protein [Proteobacteria bacterium]|uniref:GspE/PulE family protein n=1 Tax=Aquabacterium sp. TaxID=1872578 RepID=UPI0035C6A4DE|nr:type II/IV secretion system protein [Pseudomonadota bacterium]
MNFPDTLAHPFEARWLHEAHAALARESLPFMRLLERASGLPPEGFLHSLAGHLGEAVLDMPALLDCDPDYRAWGFAEAAQKGVCVLRAQADGQLWLACQDPFNEAVETWARHRCERLGLQPQLGLVHADDFAAYLARQEQALRAMDGVETGLAASDDEEIAASITLSSIQEDSSQVVKLVNSTLYDALKLQASDVHLECDAGSLHVLCRIDGVLVPITQVQGQELAEQVISRIKVMADLDIAERRVPQDGRFKVRVNGREIDFRVSIMPNIFGEDAVLRLLDRQSLTEQARQLNLDHLGLDAKGMADIRHLAARPHGMLLVTGPTGSGKTTTLYAAITEIHDGRDKIVTIEDPVEYRLPRVLQIPVNEKKGLTFARGLRSILRHDPDKIMVGEIRDDDTAQIAVQAALTGHLVFTTVHANSVFDVLGRFMHMGVDPYSLSAALNGIVSQRLVRVNCSHCAVDVAPDLAQLQQAGLSAAGVAGWQWRAGRGCAHCRGVGYKGRKAVAEVLTLDDPLKEMIATKAPVSQLRQHAAAMGMQTIRTLVTGMVARGETTLDELLRVVG